MTPTWRVDTPGTDPENRRAVDTEAEAETLRAQLVAEKPNRPVVVWQQTVDAPQTPAIDPLAAVEPAREELAAFEVGKKRRWRLKSA